MTVPQGVSVDEKGEWTRHAVDVMTAVTMSHDAPNLAAERLVKYVGA